MMRAMKSAMANGRTTRPSESTSALTRKNALFARNEIGAENWTMLASLIIRRDNGPLDRFLILLILQDVRGEPRRLSCNHPARHSRRPPSKRHRSSHAMALQPDVKPRRIGSRRRAYTLLASCCLKLSNDQALGYNRFSRAGRSTSPGTETCRYGYRPGPR